MRRVRSLARTASFPATVLLGLLVASPSPAQYAQQDEQSPRPDARLHQSDGGPDRGASDWVRIGVDYDRDGRWDAIETVRLDEFQRARQRSRQRADQARDARERRIQPLRLQGEIQQLRRIDLVGGGEKDVVVGRVRTEIGRLVSVYFGPTNEVAALDLQSGDRVAVEGVPAWLNEEPLLIARRISTGGREVTVRLPRRSNLRQFSGRITGLRTTSFRGRDGDFVVATVRLDDGDTRTVNFGQQQELRRLELQVGDQVRFLARPGRINDQFALIAQLVRSRGVTADVRGATNRTLLSAGGSRQ